MMRVTFVRALACALGFVSLSTFAVPPTGPLDYFTPYGRANGLSFEEFQSMKGMKLVESANPANVVTLFPDTDALWVRTVYSGKKNPAGDIAGLRPLASVILKGGSFYRVDLRSASPVATQISAQTGVPACSIPRMLPQGHLDANTLSSSVVVFQGPLTGNPTVCSTFRMIRLDSGASEVPVALPALRPGFKGLYKPNGDFVGVLQRTCTGISTCALTFLAPGLTAPTATTVVPSPVDAFTVMATDAAGNSAVLVKAGTAKSTLLRIDAAGVAAPAPLRPAPVDDFESPHFNPESRGIAVTDGKTLFFTENRITPVEGAVSARLLRVPLDGSAAAVVMAEYTSTIDVVGSTPTRVVYRLGLLKGSASYPDFELLTIDKTAAAGAPAPVRLFKVAADAGHLETPRVVGSNVYYSTRQGTGGNADDRAWIKADDGTLVKKYGPGSAWRFGGIVNHPVPKKLLRATLQTGTYLYTGGAVESAPYDFQMLTTRGTNGQAVGGDLSLHRIEDQKNFPLTTLTDFESPVNSGILGSYVLDRLNDTSEDFDAISLDIVGIGTASHTFDRITSTPAGVDEVLSY